MTKLGPNLKITAHSEHRPRIREVLADLLGLPLTTRGNFDLFAISGGSIGYAFVDAPADALTPEEARKGAWIEFLVEDPDATVAALAARGLTPFPFGDVSHPYFALPGGQVFRLARG